MIALIVGAVLGFLSNYFAQWPPPPRHLWHRFRFQRMRGRKCFTLPGAKTYVVPCVTGAAESPYVSRYALDTVSKVTQMLNSSGFSQGHDFDIIFQEPDEDKSEDIRRENLILVCGPERNHLVRSIFSSFPDLLRNVIYDPGPPPSFIYRGTKYTSSDTIDWALVAVKKNPYNPQRKLIFLFGLRGIGTKGAGYFFAATGAQAERLQIAALLENTEGEIEVLLRVEHGKHTITRTCPVDLLRPEHRSIDTAMFPLLPEK